MWKSAVRLLWMASVPFIFARPSALGANPTGNGPDKNLCSNLTTTERSKVRQRLYLDLFTDYIPEVRPESDLGPLPVNVDLAILSVSQLDNLDSTFQLSVWFRQYWDDPRLTWKPEDYCGIDYLPVKAEDQVWTPDTTFWILRDDPVQTSYKDTRVTVSSEGAMYRSIARQDQVHCNMDLQSFPQDVQHCNFSIGSWAHTSDDIKTIPYGDGSSEGGMNRTEDDTTTFIPGLDMSMFSQRDTHTVQQIVVGTAEIFYRGLPRPYEQIDYTFVIARESFTYINIVAWPLVIVTLISVMSPMYHPAAPGKSTLLVTLLLTLTAVSITASSWIPKLNYATALSELYSSCLTFTLFSLMEAGFSVYLVTMAREIKHGSLQWHIPLVTFLMDKLFWHFYIGGIVFVRKLNVRWQTRNFVGAVDLIKHLPGHHRGSNHTRGKQREKVSHSHGDSTGVPELNVESDESSWDETQRELSSKRSRENHGDEPWVDSERKATHTADVRVHGSGQAVHESSLPAGVHRTSPIASPSRLALEASDLDQIANKRRRISRAPTYWDSVSVSNNGHKPLEKTKEQLIRLYLGEKDLDIPKDEILLSKKNFLIMFAIAMDQTLAIVLTVAFASYLFHLTVKWNLSWVSQEAPEDSELPLLIFDTTSRTAT